MSARHNQSFWIGVFVLNLLPSIALAAPAPAASAPAATGTPADPEKLVAQAEKALDREELDTAIKLYHQAAELNYTPAQVSMGELATAAEFDEEAVGWFLMAATQGDAAGQYNLAKVYNTGTGIEKDDAKALYWFRRSAAKNYLPAVKIIAEAYRLGGFSGQIKADPEQAKTWDAKRSRLEAIARKAADESMAAAKEAAEKKAKEAAEKKANKNK
jgi:TPR repeat protein